MSLSGMLMIGMLALFSSTDAPETSHFTPGNVTGEFSIETSVLRGTLAVGGLSFGLHPIVHVADNTELTGPTPMGLLNYYRIFTTNFRYGESLRALPSEKKLVSPDTVRMHWPATEYQPFDLTGVYQCIAPDTIELETIVEAKATLPDFDVFLASYLTQTFPVSSVYVKSNTGPDHFITAEPEHGVWQVFPKDTAAVALVKDGRWDIPPSPVDWAIGPEFKAPIIYRRAGHSNLTVAMMADPEECFALFTSMRDEGHYSMYVSLFGRTLEAGETARARVRLVVGELDDDALLERWRAFLDSR